MQTVKKLKKWVLSSFDNLTDSQHKLVKTSKSIEDEWQRKEYVEDTSVVEAWCTAFREELLFQLEPGDVSESGDRQSLSESAMVTTLDAAHVLGRTAGPASERCFAENEIVPLLTRYLIQSGSAMPRKLRDGCCAVLTTITSTHPALLLELLRGVLPHLAVVPSAQGSSAANTPHGGDDANAEGAASTTTTSTTTTTTFPTLPSFTAPPPLVSSTNGRITPKQVYLAALLVAVLNKSVAALKPDPPRWLDDATVLTMADHVVSLTCSLAAASGASISIPSTRATTPATSSLSRVGSQATAQGTFTGASSSSPGESATREDAEPAAVVVYTALIGCLYRGQSEHKLSILRSRCHSLAKCWQSAVQRLSKLPRTLTIGTSKEAVCALEPAHFWQSALVEMVLELCTEGCFTQRRLSAFAEVHGSTAGRGRLQELRFDPLPAHWDTLLTGSGSAPVWLLAAMMPTCPLVEASIPFFEICLMGIDATSSHGETVYRSLVCSLMLFCAGNPCVASTLAQHGIFDVLIALLTYQQQSVFSSHVEFSSSAPTSQTGTAVASRSESKDEHINEASFARSTSLLAKTTTSSLVLSPVAQLNSNTAQLTSSFISSLAALTFPTTVLETLMSSVEAMRTSPTCQTDCDLVESLMYVLASTYMPTHVLFFSGSGSVVCNTHRFVGRWSGYTFSAWINPVCVLPRGNLLFSVSDHAGGTTELLLVANGRSCYLALRISPRPSPVAPSSSETHSASGTASVAAGSAGGASTPVGAGSGMPNSGVNSTTFVIPGSAFPAETWSHIVFTHGLVDPHVYINGHRLDVPLSLPFPKEASRRHRLQIALGGRLGENSFTGFVARMDVLDAGLSDSEVTRLFEAGPSRTGSDSHILLSLRCHETTTTDSAALHRPGPDAANTAAASTSPAPSAGGDAAAATDGTNEPPRVDERAGQQGQTRKDSRSDDVNSSSFQTTDVAESEPMPALPGSPVGLTGSLVGRGEGISMHGIIPFVSPDMKAVFAEKDVIGWALRLFEASQHSEQFAVVSRMCVCFITAPMRMAQNMADREQCLKGGGALEKLSRLILTSPDTYVDLPSALLSAVTIPGTTSTRQLAAHSSTQTVITTLLDRVRVVSGELTDGACPADRLVRNPTTANSILRELSDALLLSENVGVFLAVPHRFTQVLSLSLHLPLECVESVVMLIEKLCKAPDELEATLRFLLTTHTQLTSGQAKAEIVRMLFDVARANPGMCEKLGSCFKGTGLSFLIELIHGKNHHSEAIRVYTLRLLSLTLYTCKKQREAFIKNDGFGLLRLAMTDPASFVPIRLPTLDCVYHMAFQSFRPAESSDAALATRLKASGHSHASSSSKLSTADGGAGSSGGHRLPSHHAALQGQQAVMAMQGHLPGLVSRRLRVVHREFSFEVKRDFAARGTDDRWQSDDAYRGKGIESVLTLPQALETALGVIAHLINQSCTAHPHASPSKEPAAGPPASSGVAQDGHMTSDPNSLLHMTSAAAQLSSADSTLSEDDRPEDVILPGLGYLEKIVDVQANAEALIHTSWLRWLWQAVSPVVIQSKTGASTTATTGFATTGMTPTTSNSTLTLPVIALADEIMSPNSPVVSPVPMQLSSFTMNTTLSVSSPSTQQPPAARHTRRFASEVLARTRGIVRRVVTLEMRLNSKAPTVRRLRGTIMSPHLVRIVLEETARHFSRAGHSDLAEPDTAINVVKNLDALLQDVEELLVPFPASLGIELVTFISTIAVNSNSWVRMRMKNASSLFQTRDHFAFFLLCTIRRLTRVRPQQLIQLLDACTCNANTMVVLLKRFQDALSAKDVNELERALLLIHHLSLSDVEQSQQVALLLGQQGAGLVELLTQDLADTDPLHPPSDDDVQLADIGRNSSVISAGTSYAEINTTALPALPTSQVVEWRQTHPENYQAVVERVRTEVSSIESDTRSQEERVAKNRAALAKPTRSAELRRQQEETKVRQEFQRLEQSVEAELARRSTL